MSGAKNVISKAKTAVSKAVTTVKNAASKAWNTVKTAVSNGYNTVKNWASSTSGSSKNSSTSSGSGTGSGGSSSGGSSRNLYERAKSEGDSLLNWKSSNSKEALNIRTVWSESLEKTLKHFCVTAERISSQKILDNGFNEQLNQLIKIKEYASQWNIDEKESKWTTWDIVLWKGTNNDEYLFEKKQQFVSAYKDVIKDAADKYDIPEFLLAGVAYTEYGGDPSWIDNVAYTVRSVDWSGPAWVDENLTLTKNPDFTSFGNISIQVRRAAESVGLDSNNMSKEQRQELLTSIQNPIENIYIAAKHLSDLKNIDYSNIDSADLSEEQIKVISTRYNRGPDLSLDEINDNLSYGNSIYTNERDILAGLE